MSILDLVKRSTMYLIPKKYIIKMYLDLCVHVMYTGVYTSAGIPNVEDLMNYIDLLSMHSDREVKFQNKVVKISNTIIQSIESYCNNLFKYQGRNYQTSSYMLVLNFVFSTEYRFLSSSEYKITSLFDFLTYDIRSKVSFYILSQIVNRSIKMREEFIRSKSNVYIQNYV